MTSKVALISFYHQMRETKSIKSHSSKNRRNSTSFPAHKKYTPMIPMRSSRGLISICSILLVVCY